MVESTLTRHLPDVLRSTPAPGHAGTRIAFPPVVHRRRGACASPGDGDDLPPQELVSLESSSPIWTKEDLRRWRRRMIGNKPVFSKYARSVCRERAARRTQSAFRSANCLGTSLALNSETLRRAIASFRPESTSTGPIHSQQASSALANGSQASQSPLTRDCLPVCFFGGGASAQHGPPAVKKRVARPLFTEPQGHRDSGVCCARRLVLADSARLALKQRGADPRHT